MRFRLKNDFAMVTCSLWVLAVYNPWAKKNRPQAVFLSYCGQKAYLPPITPASLAAVLFLPTATAVVFFCEAWILVLP